MKKLFNFFNQNNKSTSKRVSSEDTSEEVGTDLALVKQYKDEIKDINIENQPFRLSGLLHILTNKIANLLQANGHTIYYDIDNNLGRYIVGDNDYIEQVLFTLVKEVILLNQNSEIVIKISKHKNRYVFFEVINPKAVLDKKAYKKYTTTFQVLSSQTQRLNTFVKSKLIAEAMKGTIELVCNQKKGTCYTFKIPYYEDKDDRSHQKELKQCLDEKVALFIGRNAYDTKRTQYIFETYGIHIDNIKLEDFEKKKPNLDRYDMAIIRSRDLNYKHISFFKNIVQDEKSNFKIIIIHELFENEKNIELSKPIAHAELYSPIIIGDVEEILYQIFILDNNAVKGINNIEIFNPEAFVIKGQHIEENLEEYEGANIAIVEDSKIDKKILQNILGQEGITLFCMHNGSEMLDLLEHEEIDIIFADINMPVMDGILMSKKIRKMEKWKKIPIIAISSMSFEHELKKMELAGMNAAITKPIEAKDIHSALKRFLIMTEQIQMRKKRKSKINFSFNKEVLNIPKEMEYSKHHQEYFHNLLKIISSLRESKEQFENMIYEEKLLALKEYATLAVRKYEEISAANMIKMFKELSYFISQEDTKRLYDYVAIYRKNWEELEVELEKYTHNFK